MSSHTYLEMIVDAIVTLSDRKGSSRQALWKCIQNKYAEADYKQFLIRLKKIAQSGTEVYQASMGRYKLNQSFKDKYKKALEKG